jgi:hypothetical protein
VAAASEGKAMMSRRGATHWALYPDPERATIRSYYGMVRADAIDRASTALRDIDRAAWLKVAAGADAALARLDRADDLDTINPGHNARAMGER